MTVIRRVFYSEISSGVEDKFWVFDSEISSGVLLRDQLRSRSSTVYIVVPVARLIVYAFYGSLF
jgi:hypothetical protein